MVMIVSEQLDEMVFAPTYEKALKQFHISVHLLYKDYVECDISELSESAIEYRNRMKELITMKKSKKNMETNKIVEEFVKEVEVLLDIKIGIRKDEKGNLKIGIVKIIIIKGSTSFEHLNYVDENIDVENTIKRLRKNIKILLDHCMDFCYKQKGEEM